METGTLSQPTLSQPLADGLLSRRWLRRDKPYLHVVAYDVLAPDLYRGLEADFRARLERGFGAAGDGERFARNMDGYDAYAIHLKPDNLGAFRYFLAAEWRALLARVMGVQVNNMVTLDLHHHTAGSAHGTVHTDFTPFRYYRDEAADDAEVLDHRTSNYLYTEPPEGYAHPPRAVIRSVAMIYFLANGPWQPGVGGEMGFYKSGSCGVTDPGAVAPPVNNRILLFECAPHSWHSFIHNNRQPRNSVILWLHADREELAGRRGELALAHWPRNHA